MKLLILLIIFYLAYRALKYRIRGNMFSGPKNSTGSERQIDNIMVKDPVCGVYFQKNSGISTRIDGETVCFCSEECKDKYLAKNA